MTFHSRLQPATHRTRASDERVYLRQLSAGEVLQFNGNRTPLVGLDELPYLVEGQADALRGGDHGEASQRTAVVSTFASDSRRDGQQPDRLVVTDCRRAQACTSG